MLALVLVFFRFDVKKHLHNIMIQNNPALFLHYRLELKHKKNEKDYFINCFRHYSRKL